MPWLEEGPPAIHCSFLTDFIILHPSTKQTYAFEYTKGFKNHGINLFFFLLAEHWMNLRQLNTSMGLFLPDPKPKIIVLLTYTQKDIVELIIMWSFYEKD